MIYSVSYGSMTAHYGPTVIEAESEEEARRKFNARGAFLPHEIGLIKAQEITLQEALRISAGRARAEAEA